LQDLQVNCPGPLTLIKSWRVAEAQKLETALHSRLAAWHRHHEWFAIPEDQLQKVCAELDEREQLCHEEIELENIREEQKNARGQLEYARQELERDRQELQCLIAERSKLEPELKAARAKFDEALAWLPARM